MLTEDQIYVGAPFRYKQAVGEIYYDKICVITSIANRSFRFRFLNNELNDSADYSMSIDYNLSEAVVP